MELDQVLKEVRSVRKFKKLDVPWYLVSECLDAATYAPNAGNTQNWRFIVVRDLSKREAIVKACEDQKWLLNAPVLIVVCSDVDKISKMFGVRGEALYAVQNCAAAIQNMLLKAYELGLGSVWIGAFDEIIIKQILEIKPEVRPQAIIALGFSDDHEKKPKREELNNVVFFEKYGDKEDKKRRKFLPIKDILKEKLNKLVVEKKK
ncbi:nitroreductase family protein [Candidatus Woesearchaeota archaeon]|nr:nitroreductase family protein [Candidatus Woesearchaeota archaeon]